MNTSTDRLERKILLKAPRSRVWRALSNAEEFGAWFGVDFKGSAFVAGKAVKGRITYPGYEHLVMEVVWQRDSVTTEDVRAALAESHPIKEPTIRTILSRLEEKGYVTHHTEGRANIYSGTDAPPRQPTQRCHHYPVRTHPCDDQPGDARTTKVRIRDCSHRRRLVGI